MGKTEKIKESDYYSPENRLVPKINEIIDVLNQKQSERVWHEDNGVLHDYETGESILYSQLKPEKQPEVSEEYLERTEYTDYPRVATTEVKPEKQEEWREELLNLPFVKEYLSQKVVANKKEEQGYAEILNMVKDREVEELFNKIDQLLSKRTRKAKLEVLRELSYEIDGAELDSYIDEHKDYFNKLGKSIWKKIKLLKEEE